LAVLGLTHETADDDIPAQLMRIAKNAATTQAELDELASLPLPAGEHHELSPGLAWPEHARRQREAVLQPPEHEITPSAQVLERHPLGARIGHAEPEREAG
jgi:hypothetical protein